MNKYAGIWSSSLKSLMSAGGTAKNLSRKGLEYTKSLRPLEFRNSATRIAPIGAGVGGVTGAISGGEDIQKGDWEALFKKILQNAAAGTAISMAPSTAVKAVSLPLGIKRTISGLQHALGEIPRTDQQVRGGITEFGRKAVDAVRPSNVAKSLKKLTPEGRRLKREEVISKAVSSIVDNPNLSDEAKRQVVEYARTRLEASALK